MSNLKPSPDMARPFVGYDCGCGSQPPSGYTPQSTSADNFVIILNSFGITDAKKNTYLPQDMTKRTAIIGTMPDMLKLSDMVLALYKENSLAVESYFIFRPPDSQAYCFGLLLRL